MDIAKLRSIASLNSGEAGEPSCKPMADQRPLTDDRPCEQESTECQTIGRRDEASLQPSKQLQQDSCSEEMKDVRLCRQYSVALHKFPPQPRDKAKARLTEHGFNLINLPTGLTQQGREAPQKVIVVSYDGSYRALKDSYKVVNQKWIEAADANEFASLAKYTFALKGYSFVVFGKATVRGQTEAEMTLWR